MVRNATETKRTQPSLTLDQVRSSLSVALLCDALDGLDASTRDRGPTNCQSPRVAFPIVTTPGQFLVGYAKTTLWADMAHVDRHPYAKELAAVDSVQPDDVIVCAAHGSQRSGIWGELLTTAAMQRGCVGAWIDGATRDVAKLRAMKFPVIARAISPYDSRDRQRVIDFDVPVDIGGVVVAPGDLVAADEDGVIVVPQSLLEPVLEAAWKKSQGENLVRDALRSGMSATEAFAKFGIL